MSNYTIEMASGLQPYMYEPELTEEEILAREERQQMLSEATLGRAGNLLWCHCDQCIVMDEDSQCKCCHDEPLIEPTRLDNDCVTELESFGNTILNPEVLKIMHHDLLIRSKDKELKKTLASGTNASRRYLAYRTFVWWINSGHAIGHKNRMVIPACVISAIRNKWPDEHGVYVGFKPAKEGYPI